jgi:2-polyprenyl-3-methyl-5-hydroxy-6-metoxy-1,4-benzoquinol methylase
VISFNDVVKAWDAAPFDAIHPTRAVSEAEYEASGQEQADALAKVLPHGTVLDFGCGDGRVAIPLARHGFKVIGADASPRMREALRARDEHLPTLVTDGSDLAEQLGRKVDSIICLAVLIHHDHEGGKRILTALRSVLRQGGLMILHWPTQERAYERKTWIEVTYWTKAEQEAMMAELGLQEVDLGLPWSIWKAVRAKR